jgi:hypothetical protein
MAVKPKFFAGIFLRIAVKILEPDSGKGYGRSGLPVISMNNSGLRNE